MIRDLPTLDKPREKALELGVSNLTDAELLAILLRTGTKSFSSLDLARDILKEIGSINDPNMFSVERLSKIKGVGMAKAISIISALELGRRSLLKDEKQVKIKNSKDIYNRFKYLFYHQKQELFIVAFLDKYRNFISHKEIYRGTIDNISIDSQDIFKEAYLHSSIQLILLHNHPSGNLFPSKEDIITTKKLLEKANILNFNIIDHVIITDTGYYSFYDNGDL